MIRDGIRPLRRLVNPMAPLGAVVTVWTAFWLAFVPERFGWVVSWHYFIAGPRRLVGLPYSRYPLAGGLHLYASYPKLQIGPLSFLVSLPVALLPHVISEITGCVLMVLAGPLTIGLIAESATRLRACSRHRATVAGLLVWFFVAPLWCELAAHWGHLDDVLTLLFAAASINAASRGRGYLAAVCIGAAAASKPWGLAFLPLALVADDKLRLKFLLTAAAVAVAPWIPFVVGDPRTLRAGGFKIPVVSKSVLSLFGIVGGTPAWVRPTQFLGGAFLAWLCVRSGRWPAAIAMAVALRLGTDPSTYTYYSTGLAVGAAVWDLLGSRCRLPILTMTVLVALYLSTYLSFSPHTQAATRLVVVVAVPVIVWATAPRTVSVTDIELLSDLRTVVTSQG